MIEEVAELGRKECIHYLHHQAVIRRDAKITKLRVVYDASSKEGKKCNAKTFKATAKGLKKLASNKELQGYLEGHRIEWTFNLERAPWWGCFFQRMVRHVKRYLTKVLGNARLTFGELLTTVVESEGTLGLGWRQGIIPRHRG